MYNKTKFNEKSVINYKHLHVYYTTRLDVLPCVEMYNICLNPVRSLCCVMMHHCCYDMMVHVLTDLKPFTTAQNGEIYNIGPDTNSGIICSYIKKASFFKKRKTRLKIILKKCPFFIM